MSNGLVVMLDMAGTTIATLQEQLAQSEQVRADQDATISHLRTELRDARSASSDSNAS